jgi:glycosyltransferase 2 family protein
MECVAFFLVLIGLGFDATPRLLLTATFVLAAATLIGSVSFLPGGLGAAEIGMTAMLLALVTTPLMTHDVAVAATLIIRFCTLWFGVGIGVIALASVRGLLGGRGRAAGKALAGAVPHGD